MTALKRRFITLLLALWLVLTSISLFFVLDYFGVDIRSIKTSLPSLRLPFSTPHTSHNDAPLPVTLEEVTAVLRNGTKPALAERVPEILRAVLDPDDKTFNRLPCGQPNRTRYAYLAGSSEAYDDERPKYFFALDLYNAAPILPRLLSSIIEAIRFLGPSQCVLSVLEGRSEDGTFEALTLLRSLADELGIGAYYLNTSDLDPGRDAWTQRIQTLAYLRNLALQPLTDRPSAFANDTEVIFLNDVALCSSDILELVHQKRAQGAHMTCGMDWDLEQRKAGSFYDVWIARGMTGDSFFHIPESGSWDEALKLFWNDDLSRQRLDAGKPLQAFSCWNGGVVFDAAVWHDGIRFRAREENECHQGEPQLFCKDLWFRGFGRIAVVPSVNVAYSDEDTIRIKKLKGTVEAWAEKESDGDVPLRIPWKDQAPVEVKCIDNWAHQFWRPWDEGLREDSNATTADTTDDTTDTDPRNIRKGSEIYATER
jgi:alpha-1,3-mannosyltransferase